MLEILVEQLKMMVNRRSVGVGSLILILVTCKGDAGATGPTGPAGGPGLSGVEIVTVTQQVNNENGAPFSLRADCPAGKKVFGGGFAYTPDMDPPPGVQQNYPSSATSWTVTFKSDHLVSRSTSVYAICANAT